MLMLNNIAQPEIEWERRIVLYIEKPGDCKFSDSFETLNSSAAWVLFEILDAFYSSKTQLHKKKTLDDEKDQKQKSVSCPFNWHHRQLKRIEFVIFFGYLFYFWTIPWHSLWSGDWLFYWFVGWLPGQNYFQFNESFLALSQSMSYPITWLNPKTYQAREIVTPLRLGCHWEGYFAEI